MEILIGLVFLLGCLFLGLFLATGSVMGYGAQKNANRALRKADRLQQKLDDILRKVTRLERGLQNLQGDLPDTESTGETLKGRVDLESELLTSEKAIDEQPEEHAKAGSRFLCDQREYDENGDGYKPDTDDTQKVGTDEGLPIHAPESLSPVRIALCKSR